MWETVLLWRRWTAAEPLRAGVGAPMVSGRRSLTDFLAFWLGCIAAAIGLGLGRLTLLRSSLSSLVPDMSSLFNGITGNPVRIVISVLALLVTAVSAARLAPQRQQTPLGRVELPTLVPPRATAPAISWPTGRARANPWARFMAGRDQTTPWIEYVVVLSVIFASGAALAAQFHAGVAFVVAILTLVELPVLCYIVNPKQTRAIVLPVHNWVRTHCRVILAVGVGVLGFIVVTSGTAGI